MVMQLLVLCYQPNHHKGFKITTIRCSLQLTQRILTLCARRSLRTTNFVASLILTPEKQNKNSINPKCQQVLSVSIFNLMLGFNLLSLLTKWSKSPSAKPLSGDSVAICNRESKVDSFSWLRSLVFTSLIHENKRCTQAMLIAKIKSKWSR